MDNMCVGMVIGVSTVTVEQHVIKFKLEFTNDINDKSIVRCSSQFDPAEDSMHRIN